MLEHAAPIPASTDNALENRFAQLIALTTLIHGNGREAFTSLHDESQDHILGLLDDLARECRRLAGIVLWNEGRGE